MKCPYEGLHVTDARTSSRYHSSFLYRDFVDEYARAEALVESLEATLLSLDRKIYKVESRRLDAESAFIVWRHDSMLLAHSTRSSSESYFDSDGSDSEDISLDYEVDIMSEDEEEFPLLRSREYFTELFSESDVTMASQGAVSAPVLDEKENIVDMAANPADKASAGSVVSTNMMSATELKLDDFFSRPVEISSTTIALNADLSTQIDIWSSYFNVQSVRAKLKNYAFIRADLNVRVAISGTPFNYGKLIAAYIPFAKRVPIAVHYDASDALFRDNHLSYLCATKGSKFIDVKDNRNLDFHFPYINFQPVMRLWNNAATALASGSNFDDTTNLGRFYLYSMNKPQAIGSAPSAIPLRIYAWLTNVSLGAPTATQLTLIAESGDERKIGPVEETTTKILDVVDVFTEVPVIGPYAKASSMVLNGIKSLAALFGFSSPSMFLEPHRVKNEPYQNGAQVVGYDTSQRINLDPLAELTVDPRIVAETVDEMTISNFCQRWGRINTFTWASASTTGVPLMQYVVNPYIGTQINDAGTANFQPTPLAFAASFFEYFRGDMEFWIQVVCSSYHRGKLLISFEPNTPQNVLVSGVGELNKQWAQVFDISETTDIRVCASWNHSRPWARVNDLDRFVHGVGATITSPTSFLDFANGTLMIAPYNNLTSTDGSSIQINVYVRSKNMMFNFFNPVRLKSTQLFTESSDPVLYAEAGVEPADDVSCFDIAKSVSSTSKICHDYFGERPLSFRSLLKRFMTSAVVNVAADATVHKSVLIIEEIIPTLGPTVGGPLGATGHPILGHLRNCFLGMKGGLKKRVRFNGFTENPPLSGLKVTLAQPVTAGITPGSSFIAADSYALAIGTVSYVPHTNGGIEFELPFYTNNLFFLAGNTVPYVDTDTNFCAYNLGGYYVQYDLSSATLASTFIEETAIADDFGLYYFIAPEPFTATTVV